MQPHASLEAPVHPPWGVQPVPARAGTLWAQRGLAASPLTRLKPPCRDPLVVCSIRPPDGVISGTVYTDGSGVHTRRSDTSRAGWGICSADTSGRITSAAHGPLPLFSQAVGSAEIYAAAAALRMAMPPLELVTDYQRFHDGWHLGYGAYTGDASRCGEAWRLFWAAAQDFGLSHISVRKVPAHLPFAAVAEGRITFQDWVGNGRADLEAKKVAALHPSNAQVVHEVAQLCHAQSLLCTYMAHLNSAMFKKGWHAHWHAEYGADDGNGGEARAAATAAGSITEQGTDAQSSSVQSHCQSRGTATTAAGHENRELISDMAASGDAATAAPSEIFQGTTATAAASAATAAAPSGSASATADDAALHSSHVLYATEAFLFCARCGRYCARTTRRSGALLSECRGAPLTRNGILVRDRLMRGIEPVRPLRNTGRPAAPLFQRPAGSGTQ